MRSTFFGDSPEGAIECAVTGAIGVVTRGAIRCLGVVAIQICLSLFFVLQNCSIFLFNLGSQGSLGGSRVPEVPKVPRGIQERPGVPQGTSLGIKEATQNRLKSKVSKN